MHKTKHIILTAPGIYGKGQGGIVRQMEYLFNEAQCHEDALTFHWLATHNHTRWWPFYFGFAVIRFLWLMLRYKPDAVILNIASDGSFWRKYILFRIASLCRIRCIAYLHGGGFKEFYDGAMPYVKMYIRQLFTCSSQVITLGKAWHDFVGTLGCKAEDIHIITNAVPAAQHTSFLPENDDGEDIPHIIFAGHLVQRKGLDELIKALSTLKDLSWRATLAGSGDDARYQQLVSDCGLGNRIHFTGWLDDDAMQKLYANADILVLPSHIENQPLCLLEALSYGLAIISTDVGTIPDILTNRHDALLIPPQDTDALTRSLAELLGTADLVKILGKNALNTYQKNHQLSSYYYSIKDIIL